MPDSAARILNPHNLVTFLLEGTSTSAKPEGVLQLDNGEEVEVTLTKDGAALCTRSAESVMHLKRMLDSLVRVGEVIQYVDDTWVAVNGSGGAETSRTTKVRSPFTIQNEENGVFALRRRSIPRVSSTEIVRTSNRFHNLASDAPPEKHIIRHKPSVRTLRVSRSMNALRGRSSSSRLKEPNLVDNLRAQHPQNAGTSCSPQTLTSSTAVYRLPRKQSQPILRQKPAPESMLTPSSGPAHSLREMQSFESGTTARATPSAPPQIRPLIPQNPLSRNRQFPSSEVSQKLLSVSPTDTQRPTNQTPLSDPFVELKPTYNTAVFDMFNRYRGNVNYLSPPLSSSAPLPPSSSSRSRTNSHTTRRSHAHSASGLDQEVGYGHESITTALPDEDPRFGIWWVGGVRPQQPQQLRKTSSPPIPLPIKQTNTPTTHKRSSLRNKSIDATPPHRPVVPKPPGPATLQCATIERWVAELTSAHDRDLLLDFFLTYRTYMSPLDLGKIVITRFEWSQQPGFGEQDKADRGVAKARTFTFLRFWLYHFFGIDFLPNAPLRQAIASYVKALGKSKDPIMKNIRKELMKIIEERQASHAALGRPGPSHFGSLSTSTLGSVGSPSSLPARSPVSVVSPHAARGTNQLESLPESDTAPVEPIVDVGFYGNGQKKGSRPPLPTELEFHNGPLPFSASISQLPPFLSTTIGDESDPSSTLFQSHPMKKFFSTVGRLTRSARTKTKEHGMPPYLEVTVGEASEFNPTGDLLFVKDGLEAYLKSLNVSLSPPMSETGPPSEITFSDPEESSSGRSAVNSVSISASASSHNSNVDEVLALPAVEEIFVEGTGLGYVPKDFSQHVPMTSSAGQPASTGRQLYLPQHFLSSPPSDLSTAFGSMAPQGTVALDDVDLSSDDDSSYRRPIRRLPAGHIVQFERCSLDSLSSMSNRRDTIESRMSVASDADSGGSPYPYSTILHFSLDGLDSSDDEGGTPEDALRRLNGIVDPVKEAARARKVELALQIAEKKKRERYNSGTNAYPPQPEDVDIPGSDEGHGDSPAGATEISDSTEATPMVSHIESPVATPTSEMNKPLSTSAISPGGTPRSVDTIPSLNRISIRQRRTSSTNGSGLGQLRGLGVPQHYSFVHFATTSVLAEQFFIIDRDLLNPIGFEELLSSSQQWNRSREPCLDWELHMKAWMKHKKDLKDGQTAQPFDNVGALCSRYQLMSSWVASEILLTTSAKRPDLVTRFIKIAFKCHRLGSFPSVVAIFNGINSPYVQTALKSTWRKVGINERDLYEKLKIFASPSNNYVEIRKFHDYILSKSGDIVFPQGKEAFPSSSHPLKMAEPDYNVRAPSADQLVGCVPYLIPYLADLDRIKAKASYITNPIDIHPNLTSEYMDSLPSLPDGYEPGPLCNITKCRELAAVVKNVVTLQTLIAARRPNDDKAHRHCLKLKCLPAWQLAELAKASSYPS